jgi:hypothetical protein
MTIAILVALAIAVPFGMLSVLLLVALCVLRMARLFGPAPKAGVVRVERLRLREAPG